MTQFKDLPVVTSADSDDTILVNKDGVVSQISTANFEGSASLLKGQNLNDLPDKLLARTNLGVDAAGTDNSTDVTLAAGLDYLTISAQEITLNQIDLSTDVTGNISMSNINGGLNADNTTFLRGDGTWVTVSGAGDVVGPASATDNAVVRFDSTTGSLIQNSSVTIDDSGNIVTSGSLTASNLSGSNTGDQNAAGVSFDNVASGLTATNVQAALDEIDTTIDNLGSLASQNTVDNSNWSGLNLTVANGGTGASTASAARTNLGLDIGTDVQAHSTVLDGTTASFTIAEETKLSGIETGATADQTDEEIQDAAWNVLGGTQTLIAVTYNDIGNNVNFVVDNDLSMYDNTSSAFITATSNDVLVNKSGNISQWTNDSNYLTSVNNSNWSGADLAIINGGTGASDAATARTNLDVYSKAEVDAIGGGILLQSLQDTFTGFTSTTSAIPYDNTIPQITEGTELFSIAITPTSATSVIEIEVLLPMVAVDASGWTFSGALFQDSISNALVAAGNTIQFTAPFSLKYRVVSGSTTARTYSFRYGPTSGRTVFIGGNTSAKFSTSSIAYMTVKEIQV